MTVSTFEWDDFVSMCEQINKEPTKEDWIIARMFHNLGKLDGYKECLDYINERKTDEDVLVFARYTDEAVCCHNGFVDAVLNGNCEE